MEAGETDETGAGGGAQVLQLGVLQKGVEIWGSSWRFVSVLLEGLMMEVN
jgi:hypothetical protein